MRIAGNLLILLLVCLSFNVSAKRRPKNPCKMIETKTDAFGKTTRKHFVNFDWNKYQFLLQEEDGKRSLYFNSSFAGVVDVTIPAESPVLLAMVDGSILEIKSIAAALPNKMVSAYGILTSWEQEFAADDETLKKLSSSRIKAIRLIVNTKEVSVELSEDEGNDILETIKCMLLPAAPAKNK